MNIFDYIDLTRICFLSGDNKNEAFTELVNISSSCLYETEPFLEALLNREQLMSTGLGFELAFPHSKCSSVIDFFITIGIAPAGMEWDSFDGVPVKLVFLIGGIVEEQEKYLKILAALSKLLNDCNSRQKLLEAHSPIEFYDNFNKLALTKKLIIS